MAAAGTLCIPRARAADASRFRHLPDAFARLERENQGRLGVAVLDVHSMGVTGRRADERFAMCSTFKMLLAAAVLKRVDTGSETLARSVAIPATGILSNSPISEGFAGKSMAIRELCAAIITRSDNTAANLLLKSIGGPEGLTRFARSMGDGITRLDRFELELNEALPGDPRDTTSPASMVANWRKLLLGEELSASSRKLLLDWLIANKTGDQRLRAGLPAGWKVGDKTGSNGENTTNDVAIFWPLEKSPVIVATYVTECPGPESRRNAVIAGVGKLVAECVQAS